jgi:uncharacterized protein (DUF58 family)
MQPVPTDLAGTSPDSARAVLRRLELAVTRRLDGMLHGDHRGLTPGHGSEPGDARPYQPGDDVRHIDWAVTARSQQPHVRIPIADRELDTWVLVDRSASLDFGTVRGQKRDLALAATAATGFLTERAGNRFGALIAEPGRLSEMPARGGRPHLLAVLARVHAAPRGEGAGPADLAGGIRRLAAPSRRRGFAVVVSDLQGRDWAEPLKRLTLRHDVLVVEIVDPRELELPDVGVLVVTDPETGATREIDTRKASFRRRYAEAAAAKRERHARQVREARADHVVLRTDRDWLLDLVQHMARRRMRQNREGIAG